MRAFTLSLLLLALPALAADPVVIAPRGRPTGTDAVVTVGQAAALTGGDDGSRDRMAKLDLIERTDVESISRKLIRYRLRLAGFDDADFTFADAAPPPAKGQSLTAEAVEEAAKAELFKRLGKTADEVYVDVVQPVAVKLEAKPTDAVEFSAVPGGGAVKLGRTQVNVTVKVNGERKLVVPVFLQASEVKGGAATAAGRVVVKARQPVEMTCRVGELVVGDAGEAMQDGKVGEPIKVKNLRSGKIVTATVSGPGAVEISVGETR